MQNSSFKSGFTVYKKTVVWGMTITNVVLFICVTYNFLKYFSSNFNIF